MSKTLVNLEIQIPHAAITFASDEGVNVLSPDVLHTFGSLVARLRREPLVRTTTIQAEGKVFLAGADIKAMADYGPKEARELAELGQGIFQDLEALPCVTVAAINGPALGGGLELALACDFRIAVKFAKLGQPEVTLGLIPGWGGISRLTKLIGPSRAKRLILSGMQVSAEDAIQYGLVDEVVNSSEDLRHRVAAFCKMFRLAAPNAVAMAKQAARDHDELTAFVKCFEHRDSREGISAFIEKRPASWVE